MEFILKALVVPYTPTKCCFLLEKAFSETHRHIVEFHILVQDDSTEIGESSKRWALIMLPYSVKGLNWVCSCPVSSLSVCRLLTACLEIPQQTFGPIIRSEP